MCPTTLVDCLLTMPEVEWEHERHFREKALAAVVMHWRGTFRR